MAFFLGWPNPDTMLEQMSSRHLAEWEIMLERWNIGDYPAFRTDVIGAKIATVIANVNAPRGRTFKDSQFMPQFEKESADPEMDLYRSLAPQPPRKGAPPRKKSRAEQSPNPAKESDSKDG